MWYIGIYLYEDLIQQVDEAKLTQDKHIETKYGLGTIRNLSSGCKTLLNIVKHSDKVINVEKCGTNVLGIIFTMDNIKIFMSRPTLFDIPDDAKIRFNDSDCIFRKNRALAPHERSAVPLGTDHCPVG